MPGFKKMNEYAGAIGGHLYSKVPKAVFAAIAVSPFINQGFNACGVDSLDSFIVTEWNNLYQQGVIPQAVPAAFLHLVKN